MMAKWICMQCPWQCEITNAAVLAKRLPDKLSMAVVSCKCPFAQDGRSAMLELVCDVGEEITDIERKSNEQE